MSLRPHAPGGVEGGNGGGGGGTPGTPDVPFEPSGGVMGPPDDPNESLAPLYHSRKNPEMASLSPLTVRKVQRRDCTTWSYIGMRSGTSLTLGEGRPCQAESQALWIIASRPVFLKTLPFTSLLVSK